MLTPEDKARLKTILKAAYNRTTLKLSYYSALAGEERVRLVEPYAVTETPAGVMVKAYQLDPDPGWRFFHLGLITKVADASETFTPRRPVAVRVGDESRKLGVAETANEAQEAYRKRVLEVLADMQVTREEVEALRKFRKEYGLSEDEVRGVHYRIFAECLQTLVADGVVTRDEQHLATSLHQALKACGCGVVD
ncbi:MAG: WYL domain-containing protein [Planctomycetota bacterium]|nr:WYL domain-containing protein [Planctomycetota bacterium]